MKFSLLPKMIVPALTDVTEELLHSRNIKLLMLDFDNTIVPYTTSTPAEETSEKLSKIRKNHLDNGAVLAYNN